MAKSQSYHACSWRLITLTGFAQRRRMTIILNSTIRRPSSSQIFQSAKISSHTTKERSWLRDSFRSLGATSKITRSLSRNSTEPLSTRLSWVESRKKIAKLYKSEISYSDSLISLFRNYVWLLLSYTYNSIWVKKRVSQKVIATGPGPSTMSSTWTTKSISRWSSAGARKMLPSMNRSVSKRAWRIRN